MNLIKSSTEKLGIVPLGSGVCLHDATIDLFDAIAHAYNDRSDLQTETQSAIKILEDENETLNQGFANLNNEHQKLQQQCWGLRHDSNTLLKERDGLNQQLQDLTIEKHDYLSQLRAISSTVGEIHRTACRKRGRQ